MQWAELSAPWQACLEESWAAYCAGTVPIGAVLVSPGGEIVSRGRNRVEDRQAPARQVCNSQLAHAELNALLSLEGRPVEIRQHSLYTAVEPCPLCMGAIYMAAVRTVYFATEDAYAGASDLLGKTWYLSHKPVKVHGPQRGGLAEFACALHIEYNLRRYKQPTDVVERERAVFPLGVALGEKLRQDNLGLQWAAEGISAAQAFARLMEWIED